MHQEITNRIIAQLEKGVRPWTKPYNGGGLSLPKRHNGQMYSGINTIILWLTADEHGFDSPYWMTAKQCYALGGTNAGQKAKARVMFSGPAKGEDKDGNEYEYRAVRWYPVFNVSQLSNLPAQYYNKQSVWNNTDSRHAATDEFILNTGADIKTQSGTPCYRPATDDICMPKFEDFRSALDYYSTITHEIVHWSGHKSRLDRLELKNKKGYAFEELVAELGAAFMMAHLGLEQTVRHDHAEYIGSWIKALNNDHKYIFQAATAAQKAVDFVIAQSATQSSKAA